MTNTVSYSVSLKVYLTNKYTQADISSWTKEFSTSFGYYFVLALPVKNRSSSRLASAIIFLGPSSK